MNFMQNSSIYLEALSDCRGCLASETWHSTSVGKILFLVRMVEEFPYFRNNLSQCDRGPLNSLRYNVPWTIPLLSLSCGFPLNFTCFPHTLPGFISLHCYFFALWPTLPGAISWVMFGGNSLSPICKLLFKPFVLSVDQFLMLCVDFII